VQTDRIRMAYGAVADLYIDLFGHHDKVPADDLAFIDRHLVGRPGPVVDVGCGPGHLTAYLHSRGADATGIDLVPEFIAHARAAHPAVPFRVGSMDEPFSAAGILAYYSLIHRPPHELDAVLAAFHRALSPGGVLVIGFFDGPEVVAFEHKVTTAYYWPPDELAARLARAGFTELERLRRPADGTRRAQAMIAAHC
jgi:SAM-dependent methyltransferase